MCCSEQIPSHPSRVERSSNPIILQYLLPDFSLDRPGRLLGPGQVVKDASWQILEMNNERFTVPELLFTPSDIGVFLRFVQMNVMFTKQPNRVGTDWVGSGYCPFNLAPS